MQKIDYWAGVPLCFALTIAAKAGRWFSAGAGRTAPRRILFIELSEMGSAILAYSSLVRAKEAFKGSELFFLIFGRNRESVELLQVMPRENIIEIEDKSFWGFVLSTLRALYRIRKLGVDTAVDLELFSRCTALLSYLTGAVNRVGFYNDTSEGLYRGALLTHPVLYNPHQHMSLNFLALFFALKAPAGEKPLLKRSVADEILELPCYHPAGEMTEKLRARLAACGLAANPLARLIIVNPDPGLLPLRGWGLDNFAQLSCAIAGRYPDAAIVVVGLKRAGAAAQRIGESVPRRQFVDFTGQTESLAELLSLLVMGALLITNDSGPGHVASLARIPALVFFGPETPRLYGPLGENVKTLFAGLCCSPCLAASNHRRTSCTDNKCMQAISVEQALRAVGAILEK